MRSPGTGRSSRPSDITVQGLGRGAGLPVAGAGVPAVGADAGGHLARLHRHRRDSRCSGSSRSPSTSPPSWPPSRGSPARCRGGRPTSPSPSASAPPSQACCPADFVRAAGGAPDGHAGPRRVRRSCAPGCRPSRAREADDVLPVVAGRRCPRWPAQRAPGAGRLRPRAGVPLVMAAVPILMVGLARRDRAAASGCATDLLGARALRLVVGGCSRRLCLRRSSSATSCGPWPSLACWCWRFFLGMRLAFEPGC